MSAVSGGSLGAAGGHCRLTLPFEVRQSDTQSFMRELLKARLSPFRHRDFRDFFLAQSLSLIGTWSHDLARSWIIVEATGSSGALGNLNMAIAVPCLFLILQGGVFVDRTDVRKLIRWTKSLMAIACLALAILSEFSTLQVWHLMVFALIEGVIVSFDAPAFQAITVRLVPRQDFQQAIALNSTNYHTSRMLGPVVAAWLLAWHGPSVVFLFDALTYLLVAIVMTRVTPRAMPKVMSAAEAAGHGLREGLQYIFNNKIIRYRMMQLMLTICCIYPLMWAVFRVYVQQKFNLEAAQFGAVLTFPALGSMAGALSFAIFKPRTPIRAMFIGVPVASAMMILLPLLNDLHSTVMAMSLAGFGLYLSFASLTVSMQLEVRDEFRGRMSSMIGMGFQAIGPLMSFPWGHLADRIGPPLAIWIATGIFSVGSSVLAWINWKNARPAKVDTSH